MSRYKYVYDMKLEEVPEPVLQLATCLSCFSRGKLGRWCRVPYCHGYYSTLLRMCSECEVTGLLGMKCDVIHDTMAGLVLAMAGITRLIRGSSMSMGLA